MKKVLALILCALMIVTAALPVFATDSATSAKLAITEVAPNPADDGAAFEYIEVINTVKNTTVDLEDYYIYRFTWANSGKYAYTALGRLLGTGSNRLYDDHGNSGTLKVSIADLVKSGEQTQFTTSGTPIVLWLNTDTTKTVEDFKTYWWNTAAASLEDATIVELNVSAYSVSGLHATANYYGNGFLPDTKCCYIVSLVHKNFAATDAFDTAKGVVSGNSTYDKDEPAEKTVARHNAADTMTMIYASGNVPGKVANRYGYLDKAAFNEAVIKAEFNNPTTASLPSANKFASFMMPKPAPDGTVQLTRVENTSHTWRNLEASSSCYLLGVAVSEDPTPGSLVEGQSIDGKYSNVEATPVTTKGLAISEIIPATDASAINGEENEFIEVTNTNTSAVTLTNYHLVLHGGTNDSGNDDIFLTRAFHGSQAANHKSYAKVAKVYQITVNGSTVSAQEITTASLESGKTALICFNKDSGAQSAITFANFWIGRGNDMNGVIVAVATYNVGSSLANRGMGFLPDAKAAYALALVDSSKRSSNAALDTALTNSETLDAAGNATNGKAIEAAADSILWIIGEGAVEKNVSCNYYGYVDMNKYYADAQYYAQQVVARGLQSGKTVWSERDATTGENAGIYQLQPNAVVMKGQPLYIYMKTATYSGETWVGYGGSNNSASTEARDTNSVGPATILNSVPTPGKLLHGQFGYDAHTDEETKTTIDVVGYQTGTSSSNIRIVGKLNVAQADLASYNYVGIEIASASAATNANTIWSENAQVKNKSNAVCTKQVAITSETVYKTLTDKNGATYTNEDGYMFAINVKDLPTTVNNTFTFRCFVEDNAGNRIYTGTYQISDTSYSPLAY